ncbi:MAG: glycosyltransferase family 4 protein [Ignavibacteriae bacterium]|nr:glycosyltransferase family 4 protein [Ignavibacteriota bacterium]
MKILIFNWQDIKNPFGGGAEVHLHEIFKRIAAKGHEITLACCKFDGSADEEIIDGIRVIRKGRRSLFNFHVRGLYKKLIKENKYDLVIDDINKIPFYTPWYIKEPLLAISHHFFGKAIFHEAGIFSGSYVYLAEKLVNSIYRNTPFVVVSDSTLNEFIERGFKRENFSIVQNAIEQERFPMKICTKFEMPTVVYFGRLKKYKSVDHLVNAFSLIADKVPDARLEFIGRGDFQPELERMVAELGLTNRTKFYGFVSEEEKTEILSKSHIVVNTSIKEGWGITNIEANASGTPVISADVPGLKDSVKEGVSGLLYEYGNIKQLSEQILSLLTNQTELIKLSLGAVEWAKTFSWDNSAELMLNRCEEIIDKNNHI